MTIFYPGTERYKAEVCVLDASSYVGFWILKKLLSKGYKVHAGLRSDGKEETTTAIKEMWKSDAGKKTLSLFTVDVLDYQTILTAMNGCSALFCSLDSPATYDEEAVETEMRGVFNAVEACARTPSVDKLIFSSSLAAGIWSEDLQTLRQVDESCWSDVEYCRKLKLWYPVAKTLSERTAWGLASDRMLKMVSVNAALVLGPDVAVQNPVSTLSYLKGAEKMQECGVLASVDVDFLADVHVSALEDPSANGRYFCFNNVVRSEEESVRLAKRLTPHIQHPEDWKKKYPIIYARGIRRIFTVELEIFRGKYVPRRVLAVDPASDFRDILEGLTFFFFFFLGCLQMRASRNRIQAKIEEREIGEAG